MSSDSAPGSKAGGAYAQIHSQLPPQAAAHLEQVLPALASPDNNIRSAAEKSLNDEWVAKEPDLLLTGLAEQVRANADAGVGLLFLFSPK